LANRGLSDDDRAARARAWRHATHAAVCDVLEPWAHGTVARSTRYPRYYDFNVVRVEDDTQMSQQALMAFADDALRGLAHRRVDFELAQAGEALRSGFQASGWKAERLLWMRHEASPPPDPDVAVEEVAYDAVHDLRLTWHDEDSPTEGLTELHRWEREIALCRHTRVLAVREAGSPVAFAQLERDGGAAEIAQVYVHPSRRGNGLGRAVTLAAIAAAGDVRDLWICADDEDRAKELYTRLGFRPAWATIEFLRPPEGVEASD
jgi:GNAT superfamily N-acetyltransferase